jgi:hypothetical protein
VVKGVEMGARLHGVEECVSNQSLNKTVESVWEGGEKGLIHRVVGEVFCKK